MSQQKVDLKFDANFAKFIEINFTFMKFDQHFYRFIRSIDRSLCVALLQRKLTLMKFRCELHGSFYSVQQCVIEVIHRCGEVYCDFVRS